MSAIALRRADDLQSFVDISIPAPHAFLLDSGDMLDDGVIAVRRFGCAEGPQIVALGGISSGRHVCGDGGWWSETIGGAVDLNRYGVVGFDFAPLRDVRLRVAASDQARLIGQALDALGVVRLHAFIGASYGGLVGLAFAAQTPERLNRLCVISAAHKSAAQALAWRGVQRRIVEFALAHGEESAGLSLARQLAMITYRGQEELESRFDNIVDSEGLSDLDRYLIARGDAYIDVMPVRRWLSLSEAIDRFAIDPVTISVPTTLVACPTDQLVPFRLMEELAAALPSLQAFHAIPSIYGHDAFLKECERLAPIFRDFIESDVNE